uniref:Aftiphilin clathrin-binding box domain-containing protein n=1 Tax=Plectus sambesii TaxID=2011161 RepID=A0A914WGM5_9BILA
MDDDCPPPPPVQHNAADEDEADLNDSRRLTAVADVSSNFQCGFDLEVPVPDPGHSMSSTSPVPTGHNSVLKSETLPSRKNDERADVSTEESPTVPADSSTSTSAQGDPCSIALERTASTHDISNNVVQQTLDGDSSSNDFEDSPEVSASLERVSDTAQSSHPPPCEYAITNGGAEIIPESSDNHSETGLSQENDFEDPERLVQETSSTLTADDVALDSQNHRTVLSADCEMQETKNVTPLDSDNLEIANSAKVPDEDAKETNNDDDDDFGDFEEFGDFAAVQPGAVTNASDSQTTNDDGGWAAFGSAPVAPANEGWAADFSAVGDWPPTTSDTPPTPTAASEAVQFESAPAAINVVAEKSLLPSLSSLIEDADLWDFGGDDVPAPDSEETTAINDLLRSFDCDKFVGTSDDALKRAFDVWLALRIIEETIALKCQWTGSTTNACFLRGLNMDANLAKMRNTGLPVFAQHLGGSLLTPLAPGQQPPSETMQASNGKATPSASSAVHIDSLSVPPAQFDWRNSGLTNPLTAASVNASSAIFDLDFLTANETGGKGGNIAAALQKDLDALGLNSPTHSTKSTDSATKQPSLLDQLMSQSVNKTTKIIPVTELSVEAKALHDSLPNLDYMHSSVLMFPIRRQDGGSK